MDDTTKIPINVSLTFEHPTAGFQTIYSDIIVRPDRFDGLDREAAIRYTSACVAPAIQDILAQAGKLYPFGDEIDNDTIFHIVRRTMASITEWQRNMKG
jgi:hypothetical protein